jgi:hypothetical protein
MKTLRYPPATTVAAASLSFDGHKHIIEQYHPDNGLHYPQLLPRAAVEATKMPLLDSPNCAGAQDPDDVWWQLSEADRHTFRVVYFHVAIIGATASSPSMRKIDKQTKRAVVTWLRWAAVWQAKSEGLSWPEAYESASERLRDTDAHRGADAMKKTYVSVQHLLKNA